MENLPKEVKQNKIDDVKPVKTKKEKSVMADKIEVQKSEPVKVPELSPLQKTLIEAAQKAAANSGATVESVLSSKLKVLRNRKEVLTLNKRESLLSNPDVLPEDLNVIFDSRYNK